MSPEAPPAPAESASAETGNQAETPSAMSVVFVVAFVLLLVAAVGFGLARLAPDDAPAKRDPSFIDAIFANVVVIAAARALLLVTAVVLLIALLYIASSVVARLYRREWLRKAGPFEPAVNQVDERLQEAGDFAVDLSEETAKEKEELLSMIEDRDEAIRELLTDREALIDEVARLRGSS